MGERSVQDNILATYGAHPDIRLWRQNTGLAYGFSQVKALIAMVNRLGTMASHGAAIRAANIYDEIQAYLRKMQPTKYNVEGFPDIGGILTYERPDGGPWARGIGIEVKGPKGKASPEQLNWGEMFESRGGVWILAYSVEDVAIRLRKEGFNV